MTLSSESPDKAESLYSGEHKLDKTRVIVKQLIYNQLSQPESLLFSLSQYVNNPNPNHIPVLSFFPTTDNFNIISRSTQSRTLESSLQVEELRRWITRYPYTLITTVSTYLHSITNGLYPITLNPDTIHVVPCSNGQQTETTFLFDPLGVQVLTSTLSPFVHA